MNSFKLNIFSTTILRFSFIVILTIPGTELTVFGYNNSFYSYKPTKNEQVNKAVSEALKRVGHYLQSASPKGLKYFESISGSWELKLSSSASLDFSMSHLDVNGKNTILLNQNWLEYGVTDEYLIHSIIKEIGTYIDRKSNGKSVENLNFGRQLANELSSIYE